jgi:hypothetical protein
MAQQAEGAFSPADPFGGGEQGSLFSGGPSDTGRGLGKTGMEPDQKTDDKAAAEPDEKAAAEPDENALLRERLAKQDEMLERILTQRGGEAAPAPVVARAPALEPPGPPPDAVTKPAEFAQWLDKKISYERQLTERAFEARSSQQEAAGNLDRLWVKFQKEYAAEADDEDLVAAAFQRVVTKNGGRMPTDTDELLSRVAKQVQTWRGTAAKPDDPPKGRTDGIGAGAGARKPAPKKTTPAEDPPKRFVDQLADLQLKTGFF